MVAFFVPSRRRPTAPFPIWFEGEAGFVERVEMTELPLVRVFGWLPGKRIPSISLATGARDAVSHAVAARVMRPDVGRAVTGAGMFSGFRLDYALGIGERPRRLVLGDSLVCELDAPPGCATVQPHYAHLFSEDEVLQRENIYGSGPPTTVSDEFKEFCGIASGSVLDFGAGNGDLALYLSRRGVRVTGLELDQPRITQSLLPEASALIKLYSGGTPLPFGEESFDWIVSTEVVEHVPGIEGYIPEFARVLRRGGRMLVTTPDITSIPSGFMTGTVPWHLLEATHVNFFTPDSLERLFSPCFSLVDAYALAASHVNGFYVPGSIGAIFRRN